MKPELVLIPKMTVHPDRICLYNEVNWIPAKPGRYDPVTGDDSMKIKYEHLLDSDRTAGGNVSAIARRKIIKSLEYLLLLANNKTAYSRHTGRQLNFKIAFITLTLPSMQQHDDRVIINKCLNQFLIEIKKFYNVKNYVWRAEKQRNRNIHFHIVVDKFIPWSEIRDRWNRICNKLGYVERYRQEISRFHAGSFKVRKDLLRRWSYKSQLRAYREGIASDWSNPNSTDIHSIKKIWNVKAYVAKYLVKEDDDQQNDLENEAKFPKQTGRLWGANRELSNPTGARLVRDNETDDQLLHLINNSGCKTYHGSYFDVIFIDFEQLAKFGADVIQKSFFRYLIDTFGYFPQLNIAAP